MTRDRPNVFLVVMDTARARTVFGDEAVMPNLHALAAEGLVCERAFSTAPWTLPSHASLFTGQYTGAHETHGGTKRFDPDVPTLAERLRAVGYQTAGFSNNPWVSPAFGFDRGFDEFRVSWKLFGGGADTGAIALESEGLGEQLSAVGKRLFRRGGHRTLLNAAYAKLLHGRHDDGARMTNWRIRRWLDRHRDPDTPFFVFVNYLEPHLEYEPPGDHYERFLPDGVDRATAAQVNQDAWSYVCGKEEMDEEDFEVLRGLYRGELAYLDRRIGEIRDYLEAAGELDETLILIAGDHGENIGDHGLMDHQYCLYDTLLHVPLVVRHPDRFPVGDRFDGLVELRDVVPTVLETAGVEAPTAETASSRSIQRHLDEGGREHVIGQYVTPQPPIEVLGKRVGELPESVRRYDRALRAVRTDRWKLIEGSDRSVELYDVTSDPDERHDVSASHPDVVDRLGSLMDEEVGPLEEVTQEDDGEMRSGVESRLEDLGYLQ